MFLRTLLFIDSVISNFFFSYFSLKSSKFKRNIINYCKPSSSAIMIILENNFYLKIENRSDVASLKQTRLIGSKISWDLD